jgi:hypothetical protein
MVDPIHSNDEQPVQQPRLQMTFPFTPSVANTIHMMTGKINELSLATQEQSSPLVVVPVFLVYDLVAKKFVNVIPRGQCDHDTPIVTALQKPRKHTRTRKGRRM